MKLNQNVDVFDQCEQLIIFQNQIFLNTIFMDISKNNFFDTFQFIAFPYYKYLLGPNIMQKQENQNEDIQTKYYTKESEAFKICKYCNKNVKNSDMILHEIKCKILKKISKPKKQDVITIKKDQIIELVQIPQQKIPCTYCGYLQSLKELDLHPNNCLYQKDCCPFCQEPYPPQLMIEHIEICQNQHKNQIKQQDEQQLFKIIEYLKVGKQKQICSVCYKPFQFKRQLIEFRCSHYFHPECIYPWFQQDNFTCVICKK